jgi:hypothetical protein
VLLTYAVNAGTVFYLGLRHRYRHGDQINPVSFPEESYMRTQSRRLHELQLSIQISELGDLDAEAQSRRGLSHITRKIRTRSHEGCVRLRAFEHEPRHEESVTRHLLCLRALVSRGYRTIYGRVLCFAIVGVASSTALVIWPLGAR